MAIGRTKSDGMEERLREAGSGGGGKNDGEGRGDGDGEMRRKGGGTGRGEWLGNGQPAENSSQTTYLASAWRDLFFAY